ncbi:hypothetical protein J3A83DRAFT_4186517 [Scleroderma citrinum]
MCFSWSAETILNKMSGVWTAAIVQTLCQLSQPQTTVFEYVPSDLCVITEWQKSMPAQPLTIYNMSVQKVTLHVAMTFSISGQVAADDKPLNASQHVHTMEIPACLVDYATPPLLWTSLGHQSLLQLNHPKQETDGATSEKAKIIVDLIDQEDTTSIDMARQKSSLNKKPLIPESPSKMKAPSSENSSLEAIHHIKEVGKQAHLQAEKLQKTYDGHIHQGHKFKDAFENVLNHYSDKALALYLLWRGFHENQSQSTVEDVHAAFKKLWDNIDGNPVSSAEVDDVMASIKHKKEYMNKVLTWSMTTCPELESVLHFISLVLTRCFELVKLKYLRGKQDTLTTNERNVYYEIHLRNQKDLTSCNLFFWLVVWVRWVEHVQLGQAMVDGDYIFPAIGANGVLKPCKPLSQDAVQEWISEATMGTGIEVLVYVCTHWAMMAIANGLMVGWMGRQQTYELHSYKNDHSDTLGPFSCEADMSLAATREELQMFQLSVSTEICKLNNNIQAILRNVTNSLQDLTQVVHSSQLSSSTIGHWQ